MNWSEILTVNSDPSKPLNELIAEISGAIGHKPVRTVLVSGTATSSGNTVLQVSGGSDKRLLGVVCQSSSGGITYSMEVSVGDFTVTAFSCTQSGTSKHIAFLVNDYILRSNSTSYIAFIPSITNAGSASQVNYPTYVSTGNVKIACAGLSDTVSDSAVYIMQPTENLKAFTVKAKTSSSSNVTVKVFAIYEQD